MTTSIGGFPLSTDTAVKVLNSPVNKLVVYSVFIDDYCSDQMCNCIIP